MLKRSGLLFCLALIAGCVATYSDVDLDEPHATLVTYKGYDKGLALGTATVQEYWVVPDRSCKKMKRLSAFTWASGPRAVNLVPTGKPLILKGITDRMEPGLTYEGAAVRSVTCTNFVSFTPKTGRLYEVRQKSVVNKSCQTEIVDFATGLPPADLVYADDLCPAG